MANGNPYWQTYDPSASGLIPKEQGSWRKLRDYIVSDPLGFLGSRRPDRWRAGRSAAPAQVPTRRAVRNMANRVLPEGIPYAADRAERFGTPALEQGPWQGPRAKDAENAQQAEHAHEVAATHASGGTTVAQGETHQPSPGQIDPGYRSRMNAVRMPGGRIVFTNMPQDYVPEVGPSLPDQPQRMRYEEAIAEKGGRVSTPMETAGGGTAYIHPEAPPSVALENRGPMSERDIIERGASMAAAETDPTDTRSIMERRAWTERRLGEERIKAMEEAEIATKELAADPEFAARMAEIEGRSSWGDTALEQGAEAERTQLAQDLISTYEAMIGQAIAAGDQEAADYYEQILRMRLRGLGRTVPEPRAPGMEALFGSAIGDTVDERLEEKKAPTK
jgi:hypothetical protein